MLQKWAWHIGVMLIGLAIQQGIILAVVGRLSMFFTERNTLSNGLWKFERGTIVFAGISKNFENRAESLCT